MMFSALVPFSVSTNYNCYEEERDDNGTLTIELYKLISHLVKQSEALQVFTVVYDAIDVFCRRS